MTDTKTKMHEAIKKFIIERRLKREESLLVTTLEKKNDGGFNKVLLKHLGTLGLSSDEDLRVISSRKKAKEQNSLTFYKEQSRDLITLANKYNINISELQTKYKEQLDKLISDHDFVKWLDSNCKNSDAVSVATHVPKLTHSSNKGTCFLDQSTSVKSEYITTSSLLSPKVDGVYDSASYSALASLLLVKNNGSSFYEQIMKGNFDGLEGFTKDSGQLENWKTQLKKTMVKPDKATNSLSKQVYFPTTKQPKRADDWHLLALLVSSSLAQDVYERTGSKEFNDNYYSLRKKSFSTSTYSDETLVTYPKKATLMVTQSSHQNTSILNGQRSGRLMLLPTQPPIWQSQLKPPSNMKSWFDKGITYSIIKDDIKYLRNYLIRFQQLELSTKAPEKQEWLLKRGKRILSNVMAQAEAIHNLTSGWSAQSDLKLKQEHQYFLDPYRTDLAFQKSKEASDWQNIVAEDFVRWLNKQLQGKEKKFTPQKEYSKLWKGLMLESLRENNRMVKAVLAQHKEQKT